MSTLSIIISLEKYGPKNTVQKKGGNNESIHINV